jgi:8-oxo-(d)GTP phosphatase
VSKSDAGAAAPTIQAAGGVLWRMDGEQVLTAVVHRPRYDDWSLPKGKLEPGEYPLLGAVREVGEETGSTVNVRRRLVSVDYAVGDDRKRVQYWSMKHVSGEHHPSREVDKIRWLPLAEARRTVSYPADRAVLADFESVPAASGMVLLMRHAKAGKRAEFLGEDWLRPLDKIGRRQARDAIEVILAFAPQAILAADRVRCEQTVAPVAERLGLPLVVAPEFSDEFYVRDPKPALEAVRTFGSSGQTTLICSQGVAIPGLLVDLPAPTRSLSCRKGSIWALSIFDGQTGAADYYSHPGS